jgi:hypothetical protein
VVDASVWLQSPASCVRQAAQQQLTEAGSAKDEALLSLTAKISAYEETLATLRRQVRRFSSPVGSRYAKSASHAAHDDGPQLEEAKESAKAMADKHARYRSHLACRASPSLAADPAVVGLQRGRKALERI